MKIRRVDTTTRLHALARDRVVVVEVRKGEDGRGVDGLVRLGIAMPAVPWGTAARLPIERAIETATDTARRGGIAEVLVHDPNGLWPPA